tara:strand:- start:8730 stop:9008 length:279 start_codon:yes stop_codon:yes gene_type:complete
MFIKEALSELIVGQSFVVDDITTRMLKPSRERGNMTRRRMNHAQAAALIAEWVRKGFIQRVEQTTKHGSRYVVRKRVPHPDNLRRPAGSTEP